ncbi:hypothetical protein EUAN_13460 [Andreesenia angusta]|uniref:Uncharacterized protein n=1 Tax=Andreesenia angusta TaxID=39480 RepID=A0A1S1V6L6_9FIRM|nr:hypothetical protein [Andreesenia angusta]OHW62276.1 hypothetical protein EUAN_13460 [Andreesenia angusta]
MDKTDYKPNWIFYEQHKNEKLVLNSSLSIATPVTPKKIIKDALKKTSIVSDIYEEGKNKGKKEGYERASCEYKDKLLKQAEVFLSQSNDFKEEKAEYEKLLYEYETHISELEQKKHKSKQEMDYLSEMMSMERKLVKLQSTWEF